MRPREWTIKWDDEFQYRDGVSAYIQIAEGNEADENERVKVIEKSWADAEIARLAGALNLALFYVEGDATYEGLVEQLKDKFGIDLSSLFGKLNGDGECG